MVAFNNMLDNQEESKAKLQAASGECNQANAVASMPDAKKDPYRELKNEFFFTRGLQTETFAKNRLHDMWFLNGDSKKYPIRFLRKELADSFHARVFRAGKEYIGKDDFDESKLCGTWDLLLIELFDNRFVVSRTQSGFQIESLPVFCIYKRRSGAENTLRSIEVTKKIVDAGLDGLPAISNGKCKYVKLANKGITVEMDKAEIAEAVCCRSMILYILAKSYTYKLEAFLEELSSLAMFTKVDCRTSLCQMFPFNPQRNKVNRIYKEIVNFKNHYFFMVPLNLNRVDDLADVWDDLYSFYRIKTITDEISLKINDLTLISKNTHASVITMYMFFFALLSLLLKAGDIANFFSSAVSLFFP